MTRLRMQSSRRNEHLKLLANFFNGLALMAFGVIGPVAQQLADAALLAPRLAVIYCVVAVLVHVAAQAAIVQLEVERPSNSSCGRYRSSPWAFPWAAC